MPVRLDLEKAVLMVIDLQEKLLPHIDHHPSITSRAILMIRAARELGIPLVWTEQYKKGLGETVASVREAIADAAQPMEKTAFGCLNDDAILQSATALATDAGRRQLILVGIETHVCVLQTAIKALETGWEVFVAEDAVSSQRPADRDAALRRMQQAGAVPATVEMLIMEALTHAKHEKFKAILGLLKG